MTPPSLRFLGRKVYLCHGRDIDLGDAAWHDACAPGTLVDETGDRSANSRALACVVAFDLYRQPLRAGRQGRPGSAALHRRLRRSRRLDRFAGDIEQKLTALLRFLGPLTGGASATRAF